jgi:hypothetical protein
MRFASDDVRDHMVCRKKEWTWNGLHALADEIAPASPPVIARKDEVPYYIAGVLQDAELTNKRTRLPFSSIMDSPQRDNRRPRYARLNAAAPETHSRYSSGGSRLAEGCARTEDQASGSLAILLFAFEATARLL